MNQPPKNDGPVLTEEMLRAAFDAAAAAPPYVRCGSPTHPHITRTPLERDMAFCANCLQWFSTGRGL